MVSWPSQRSVESSLTLLIVLVLAGITTILAWVEYRGSFPNDDIIVYGVIGKLWGQGLVPYRDAADHKPPMIYLFFRLCFWFGGVNVRSLYQGYIWLTGLTTIVLVVTFRRSLLCQLGLAFALCYACFSLEDPLSLSPTAFLNTEQLASAWLAMTLGCLVAHRKSRSEVWTALAGVTFGCAVLSKQPAAMFSVGCLAHLVTTQMDALSWHAVKRLAKSMLVFALGVVSVIVACVLYFWTQGALSDLVFWTYVVNLSYSGPLSGRAFLRQAMFVEHVLDLKDHLMYQRAWPYLAGVVAMPFLLILRRSWLDLVNICWLISALLSTSLNLHHAHSHYQVFYQVPLALACAVLLQAVASVFPYRRKLEAPVLVCLLAIFCVYQFTFVTSSVRRFSHQGSVTYEGYENPPLQQHMAELEKYAGDNPRVLFYSQNLKALFYTRLIPASKYIYDAPGVSSQEKTDQMLESSRVFEPRVALFGANRGPPEVSEYLQQNYEPLGLGAAGYGFVRRAAH